MSTPRRRWIVSVRRKPLILSAYVVAALADQMAPLAVEATQGQITRSSAPTTSTKLGSPFCVYSVQSGSKSCPAAA